MYYVYMLRCKNDMIYTGITTDVMRRLEQHTGTLPSGAKFTRSHAPEKLEAVWSCENRSLALRLEARIKKLRKPQKERLIKENAMELLTGIDEESYTRSL